MRNVPFDYENNRLSIVIATLGGDSLSKTIELLLNESMAPSEILICIPQDHSHKVAHLADETVKIIATQVKGQVRQRAVGFSKAIYPLVLQLDDDILLEKDTLQRMVQYILQLGKGNVVGPVFYGQHTHACIHKIKTGLPALQKNLFDSIICAAPWGLKKMGVVTSIGLNYGVDDQFCDGALKEAQWLSGGCVLSWREDLVTDDFFPFTGKAYCEDVIHSYLRKGKKIRSWVATGIRVYIDEPEPEFSKAAVDKVIKIRRYLIKLIRGPQWRLSIYELFCKIRSLLYDVPAKK